MVVGGLLATFLVVVPTSPRVAHAAPFDSVCPVVGVERPAGLFPVPPTGTIATQADIAPPAAVAVDTNGDVYSVTYHLHQALKVTAATGQIASVPVPTAAPGKYLYPRAVAIDRARRRLYIGSYDRVWRIDLNTGVVTPFVGDGTRGPITTFAVPCDRGGDRARAMEFFAVALERGEHAQSTYERACTASAIAQMGDGIDVEGAVKYSRLAKEWFDELGVLPHARRPY